MLKYGRNMEREADALAVEETYAASIDPSGIGVFFRKLMVRHDSDLEGLGALFTTHPPTSERVEQAAADVARLPPKTGLRKDSERFRRIKRIK